jgi:hypothetical protein
LDFKSLIDRARGQEKEKEKEKWMSREREKERLRDKKAKREFWPNAHLHKRAAESIRQGIPMRKSS